MLGNYREAAGRVKGWRASAFVRLKPLQEISAPLGQISTWLLLFFHGRRAVGDEAHVDARFHQRPFFECDDQAIWQPKIGPHPIRQRLKEARSVLAECIQLAIKIFARAELWPRTGAVIAHRRHSPKASPSANNPRAKPIPLGRFPV